MKTFFNLTPSRLVSISLLTITSLLLLSCSLVVKPKPTMGSYQYNVDLINAIKDKNPTYCAYDGLVVIKISDKESTLSYSANRYTLKANLHKECEAGNIAMTLYGPLNIPVATAEYNTDTKELKYSSSYDKNPQDNAESLYRILVTYGALLTIPLKTPQEYYNVTVDTDNATYTFRSTEDVITANHMLQITGIYLSHIDGAIGYSYRRNGKLQGISYEDKLYRLQMDFQKEWLQHNPKKNKKDGNTAPAMQETTASNSNEQ